MRAFTLLVLVVLGCGNVTADPKDGAAGAGGVQAAAGGAGGSGEAAAGAAGGAGELGGAAGQGLATTGACAGLCSAPIAEVLTPHVPLTLTNQGSSCYAVTNSVSAYYPSVSCSYMNDATFNGALLNCSSSRTSVASGDLCVRFVATAPIESTVTVE